MEYPDLTGRFLILDDGEGFTLSRFAERVHDLLYLMEPRCPRHGEMLDYGEFFIVDIASLALLPGEDSTLPRARIFPDYAAVERYHEKMGGVGMPGEEDEDDGTETIAVTLQ